MSNRTLAITLSNSETITDPYWINMEIVEEELADGMTIAAAAEMIDALYEIETCGQDNPDLWNMGGTREPTEESPTEEKFSEVVSEIVPGIADCRNISAMTTDPGSYNVQIKVYRSHELEKYKLRVSNGTAGSPQRIENEQVVETVSVENATHVTMEKPVNGAKLSWIGASSEPEINILGNTFWWEGEVTGTLRAEFGTNYDLVDVHVHGQIGESTVITGTVPMEMFGEGWYSGTEDASELTDIQNIQCSVLAFYHYQYEELILNRPENDSSISDDVRYGICQTTVIPWEGAEITGDEDGEKNCYQRKNNVNYCLCTKSESRDRSRYTVSCPAGVKDGTELDDSPETTNYVDCGEREEPWLSEVYEAKCCYPPASDLQARFYPKDEKLPWCKTRHTAFVGGKELDPTVKAELEAKYKNISFIGVAPPSTGCGEWRLEQVVTQQNCCDGVPQIVWDYENSVEVIADDSSGYVFVTGGRGPYTWKVRGQGAYTNASHTKRDATTDSGALEIFMADGCGIITVYVTDGCSSDSEHVRSATGEWVLIRITPHNFPYFNPAHDPDSSTSTNCLSGIIGMYTDWRYSTTINGKYMTRVSSCMAGKKATGGTDFFSEKCTARPIPSCEPYFSGTCNLSSYEPIPDVGVYGGEPVEEWRTCLQGYINTSYCRFDHYFPVMKIETWEWRC